MSKSCRWAVPVNACDSHIHIFDDRFQRYSGEPKPGCTASDYRRVQRQMGTTRTVVVTPRPYVTDSYCTLDAISQLGSNVTRGVTVLHPTVSETQLKELADGGIRGIRFTLSKPAAAVTTIDMVEPLAERIKDLGWHVQLNVRADQIAEYADLLRRLQAPIVFDHMARLPQADGIRHEAFNIVRGLLESGKAWVKLTSVGYSDETANSIADIARTFISIAPERLVWGTDWPHGGKAPAPDDNALLARLSEWTPDETAWRRILVDNPQVLYDFPK